MSIVKSNEEDAIVRCRFEKDIMALYSGRSKKPVWSRERINDVIKLIEEFNSASETKKLRNSAHYYYANNYEIMEEGGRKCLVQKLKDSDANTIKIVPVEEYYDVLDEIHRSTGHGGRDKMLMALRYVCFIPTPAVLAFLKSCHTCLRKKVAFKKGASFLTRAMDAFSNRGLIKLIDMQSTPDGRYQWILHYQECSTKFTFLRPLTSNDAAEVAFDLLKIFLEIGCPAILETNNTREYTADVIKELASQWPSCKILNGRPVPETSNASTSLIDSVSDLLTAWMRDNSSINWAKGLYFVQFQKNCTYHPSIQQTPYKALFRCEPKTGMQFKHSNDLNSKFTVEEDLECELTRKFDDDIENLRSGSCAQKVENANPFGKVREEVLLPEPNKSPVQLDHGIQIKIEYDDTDNTETMRDVTTEVNIKSASPSGASNRESSSTHLPILCAVCGDKTVPAHSCVSCHRIIHETCGVYSLESPNLICRSCVVSVKNIKTECDDTIGNEKKLDLTTELDIKSEGEDLTTDESMDDLTPSLPEDSMRRLSSTNQLMFCAVCGDKTVPTHSCDSCQRIIHDTCGVTSFGSPTLLCPNCHKNSIKKTNDHFNIQTDELRKKMVCGEDASLAESPKLFRQPVIANLKTTTPATNFGRNIEVNIDYQKVPKLVKFKRSGYSNIRCRCKESDQQCFGLRCLCQMKNQPCTTNCHNPLKCKNQGKVTNK